MVILVGIILASILCIFGGCIYMKIRSKSFTRSLSKCPACGGKASVHADPSNSRLILQCGNGDCGKTSFRHVRASAMSLFGVARFLLIFLIIWIFFLLSRQLKWSNTVELFAAFGVLVIGWIVVSFLVRFIAHIILECNPSPIWQNEIVAHLAPPPFWQGGESRKDQTEQEKSER
jgi:ribosomal protein S27AE